MAVMARLLEPTHFGLVAIANVSLRFFSYFAQMGIGPALIQKPTLSDGEVRAALALSVGVSSFFFVLAVSTAGMIESYFEMEGLGLVMRVLAINFIVVGFSSVSLGLMRRNTKFKALAIIEIVSYVCGYGLVGLCAAYYGAGVWTLVAAFVIQTSLSGVLSYVVTKHPLGLRHTKEERSHFIGFGGRYSIIGFLEFLASNVDALIIGKLMGATFAGYYNRATLLANLPVQHPANILTRALFPIMSSMGNQYDKQSINIQLSTLLVGSYAFAVGTGIYVSAPDIVKVLLGDKWLDAIPLLQVLAWSIGPLYISHVAGVTLDSMAKLTIKMRIQFSLFPVLLLLLMLAANTGKVTNIAMAIVVTEWLRVFVMGWVLIHLLKISLRDAATVMFCIVVIATTTALSIFVISIIMDINALSIFRLLAEIVAGIFGVAVGLVLVRLIVARHPAILYLGKRIPRFANLLKK